MSRATTEAWYNADRIDRLKLVAAYFALNSLTAIAVAIWALVEIAGISGPSPIPGWVVVVVLSLQLLFAAGLMNAARLLWNREKRGAYWAIAFCAFGLVKWLFTSLSLFGGLFDWGIPLVLIWTSWSALKSEEIRVTPRSKPAGRAR